MNKIFVSFQPPAQPLAGNLKGKKHHLFSKERRLRRREVCEGLSICFYPVLSRAESAIAFSWLHPEVPPWRDQSCQKIFLIYVLIIMNPLVLIIYRQHITPHHSKP